MKKIKTIIAILLVGALIIISGCSQKQIIDEGGIIAPEENQFVEIILTKQDCLNNNGKVSGDLICEFNKPKIYSENEEIPQDYANGQLLIYDVTKEVCEKNNGYKTFDGNGIEFCFIPLDNLPKIIDRGGIIAPEENSQ